MDIVRRAVRKCYSAGHEMQLSLHRAALRRHAEHVLALTCASTCENAEADFTALQKRYSGVPEYGYDPYSTWRRAVERFNDLLRFPQLETPGARILDVGCGDGMLAAVATMFGHIATNADKEDWRESRARRTPFIGTDLCSECTLPADEFDLVCSFNSFEHFVDPGIALRNLIRTCRPGGIVALRFCPIYAGPWGLHAYRSLRMPYPQFLFHESFILDKLSELGIRDLGRQRQQLQYVNRWRIQQYRDLYASCGCEILEMTSSTIVDHLNLVLEYPEAFRGRGLSVEDLTVAGLSVTLRKPHADALQSIGTPCCTSSVKYSAIEPYAT